MPKYTVYMNTVVTAWVTVEAADREEAIELAFEDAPYAPGFANYEFGEWGLSSEFSSTNDPSGDVEEVD